MHPPQSVPVKRVASYPSFYAATGSLYPCGKNGSELSRLKLPDGFHIAVFAEADSARMMVFTPGGVLLVSEPDEGKVVALPDPKHTGKAERSVVVVDSLTEPHGLGFYQGRLYVAENARVRSYDWDGLTCASNPNC